MTVERRSGVEFFPPTFLDSRAHVDDDDDDDDDDDRARHRATGERPTSPARSSSRLARRGALATHG
jgi:hypothetical protein